MSRVKANIAANVVGQGWTILLSLACTPFYIKLLGVEAYGLLAFYLIVQSLVQILDFGLGGTLNREVAQRTIGGTRGDHSFRVLIVTLERWYWLMGIVLGSALFFALPAISSWWLRSETLTSADLLESGRVFAVVALLQWPSMFYQTALVGMQHQVALNAMNIPFATLGSVGGVLFIWLGPRSVSALVAWQAGCLLCSLAATYLYFWHNIGFVRRQAVASVHALRRHWRFSLGMSGITITGVVLIHIDKLLLSRLLPLQVFAHYSLAAAVSRGLYFLIAPVFGAYFPRLSSLVATGQENSVRLCYQTATQVMAALILPLAATITLFSQELVQLWLRDANLASAIAPLASWLVVGTCLNGLMNIPFALQLAHGKTAIGFLINIGLVLFIVPSTIYAVLQYGAVGGAIMWAVANGLYLMIGLPITHKLLVRGGLRSWFLHDILPPLAAAVIVVGVARACFPSNPSDAVMIVGLLSLWAAATALALACTPQTRSWATMAMRRLLAARPG